MEENLNNQKIDESLTQRLSFDQFYEIFQQAVDPLDLGSNATCFYELEDFDLAEQELNAFQLNRLHLLITKLKQKLISAQTKNKIMKKLTDEKSQLMEKLKQKKNELRKKVKSSSQKIRSQIKSSNFRRNRDKLGFLFGVINLIVTSYLIGFNIKAYLIWHSLTIILLILIRMIRYLPKGWIFYVFDFCYFANALILIYIWFFPQSILLFKICFCYSFGPLIWAIPTYRNSLVFHSLDRLTSVFIHAYSPLAMFCIKFLDQSNEFIVNKDYISFSKFENLIEFPLFALLFYFCWVIIYYYQVFVVQKLKTKQERYRSSFKDFTSNIFNWKHKYCYRFGEKYAGILFMTLHIYFFMATSLFTTLLYNNKIICFLFMCTFLSCSVWNGASFYMEYFSKMYEQSLKQYEKIEKEIFQDIQQNEPSSSDDIKM